MKEYIEREALNKVIDYEIEVCNSGIARGVLEMLKVRVEPAADVVEADRLGRVGRLMLPNKGCPRGPIGRLGMAGGKTQDKKAILVEELCCMDTFEDVDGNVWRPVQEEVLQEVIEILRKVVDVVRCKDCEYYAAMITDTVSGNMETAPWGICTQPWFNSDEYDDIEGNKLKLVLKLIARAAFMAVTLEDLEKYISEHGCTEEYQNGENQRGKKKSSAPM